MYTYDTLSNSLPIPIPHYARDWAKKFAQKQPTSEKKKQVYCNTLAVLIVRSYLQMMNINTNLQNSDSWNPITQLGGDVADLEVVGVGRLECRPVLENESICNIPAETWSDRLGYVIVKLSEPFTEGLILGFTPTAGTGVINVSQLQPIEDLLEKVHLVNPPATVPIPFTKWLEGLVPQGWENIDSLLQDQPRLAWRHGSSLSSPLNNEDELTWGKILNLGLQIGGHSLVLLITLKPEDATRMVIRVSLQTLEKNSILPPGISLTLVSEQGQELQTITSRNHDNRLYLSTFRGQFAEMFSIKVKLDEKVLEERFII